MWPDTQLVALFATDEDLRTWSPGDAARALATEGTRSRSLHDASTLAAFLETVRIQLEGDRGGSRFPALWNLAIPLVDGFVSGWHRHFLDHVLSELAAIESELERLPVERAATVCLGAEGFAEIYGRESPGCEKRYAGQRRGRNLRAWFADTIDEIKSLCVDAKGARRALAFVRRGVPVVELWNLGNPDPDRPRPDVS